MILAQVTRKDQGQFSLAMSIRLAFRRMTAANAFGRIACLFASFCLLAFSPAGRAGEGSNVQSQSFEEIREYCSNIAASAESIRIGRRRQQLAELEKEIAARLMALEERQTELRKLLDRLEAFERKTGDALAGLYSRMKPEAAAAQLTQLDDDIAAALMLQLKSKISGSILGEMEASRGAALAKRIAELRNGIDGKKP